MIRVKVFFKSYLRTKTGLAEWEVDLPELSCVYDVAQALGRQFGREVEEYLFDDSTGAVSVLFTRNKLMCTKDQIVQDGDQISVFPALAGG